MRGSLKSAPGVSRRCVARRGQRHGVLVAGFAGERICELTHFETTLAPHFGLPRALD
ncbi:hypothetical protein GCM10011579_030540 [Streptomyces albiflavescens]|uniref:Uncharacterized protein n=1 Tax=Streptomyces albiflavescens TaxID=1623582 RepID=A0A917Y2N4_9ACTN|nr:hypothetical protein GCM10011579_030540 [Streptomyces albiflavescens]